MIFTSKTHRLGPAWATAEHKGPLRFNLTRQVLEVCHGAWPEELSTIQSIQPWLGDKRGELREARQECQRGGRAVRALGGRGGVK